MDYETIRHLVVDHRGVRLTIGLFEELNEGTSGVKPVFKLSDWRRTYVSIADPTGYAAAMELLGDWEHWQLLVANQRFARELESWNKEVEIKLRSEAMKQLMKQSRLPTGTAAAKWLAEAGFVQRDKRKKGAKQEEEQQDKAARASVSEDAARLGLKVVK